MVAAAGVRYSGVILGALVLKYVIERLLPDVARTLRMWRQFMPIYIRYRWTSWRYQTAKGYSMQARTGRLDPALYTLPHRSWLATALKPCRPRQKLL